MLNKKKHPIKLSKIIVNKKAYYNYNIEKNFFSGLVLEGWEIKSIRSKKINISESYIHYYQNEMYLMNATFQPLHISSQSIFCNPTRKRKLLLHRHEINFLSARIKNTGYTLITLSLFWKKSWCKLEFGIAKGKTLRDKRLHIKNNEWKKEKLNILKKNRIII
ncbi:SsrA-binding protein SmpB [Buchnera aphidicola]|uniref:SsrA-binding protein SmpB n=1 Tax=Buchnera aphidicola TaxID=9 RepID=UPI003464D842